MLDGWTCKFESLIYTDFQVEARFFSGPKWHLETERGQPLGTWELLIDTEQWPKSLLMAYCRGRTPCLLGNYELIHQWETKDMLQQLSTSISSQTWSKIRVIRWFSQGQRNSFPQTWITGFRIRLGLDLFIFGADIGGFWYQGHGTPKDLHRKFGARLGGFLWSLTVQSGCGTGTSQQ